VGGLSGQTRLNLVPVISYIPCVDVTEWTGLPDYRTVTSHPIIRRGFRSVVEPMLPAKPMHGKDRFQREATLTTKRGDEIVVFRFHSPNEELRGLVWFP